MASMYNTFIGYENYMNSINKSLFSQWVMPTDIDKGILKESILLRCGEFESLYGDPEFLEYAIGVWSRKMLPTFTKWSEAMSYSYNPIENYDRYEDITTTNTGTVGNVGNTTNNATITNQGTSADTGTVGDSGNTTNKISAYNDDQLVNNSSDTTTNTRTLNTTNTVNNTTNNNATIASSDTRTDNLNEKRVAHIHGNIGVKTAAEMLGENNELVASWNLYDRITDLFTAEFAVAVY